MNKVARVQSKGVVSVDLAAVMFYLLQSVSLSVSKDVLMIPQAELTAHHESKCLTPSSPHNLLRHRFDYSLDFEETLLILSLTNLRVSI